MTEWIELSRAEFVQKLLRRWEYLCEHEGLPHEKEIVENVLVREVRAADRDRQRWYERPAS